MTRPTQPPTPPASHGTQGSASSEAPQADHRTAERFTGAEMALILLAVFLTSLAFLAYQIAASRLLSLLLSYHFVFALVSLAMLGLGLGGVIARFAFRNRLPSRDSLRVLAGANAVAALAILVGLDLVLRVADHPQIGEPLGVLLVLAILLVPLTCAGLAFAQLFRSFGGISGRVYGFDLAGAAVGCLGVIWALDHLGGVGSLLLTALLAAGGAIAFAWPSRTAGGGAFGGTAVVLAVLVVVFTAFAAGRYDPHVPVGANPEKEIHDAITGPGRGTLEDSRWSSFGRTDLISFGDRRDYKDIYIDGTAGSPMYRFTGDFDAPGRAVETLIEQFPGYFPFLFLPPEAEREPALIIGPGGGRDVLLARMGGFDRVRAVEVNPDLVDIVRSQADYNGDLYGDRADVEVIVDEGRSFVRRDSSRYGLVMLSLPVTNTSRSREGFALTESFLLTAEALEDYVDALSPEGMLVIVAHDEAAILRLLLTAIAAMERRGLDAQEVMARSYVLGSFPYPVLVLGQSPIAETEARAMFAEARSRGYSLTASYFPGIGAAGAVSPVLQAIEQGVMPPAELIRLAAEQGSNVSVVDDDSPFFHHFEIAPPAAVTLVAAVAALLTVIILLGAMLGRRTAAGEMAPAGRVLYPLLFLALGVGFMLIEVSLIQRFMLFLGQPVHVLAVVLFSLLLGMSAGSLASSRIAADRIAPAFAAAGLAAAAMIALLAVALPLVFDAALFLSLPARTAVAATVLIPLGVLLGLPFPLGVRALALTNQDARIPWMWAINGTASVLGASAAILVAMLYGLASVLVAAVVCYLVVALLGLVAWRYGAAV